MNITTRWSSYPTLCRYLNCTMFFKRGNHKKFISNMFDKQANLLGRFDREIEDTMERMKKNHKIKTKRYKVAHSQTASIIMGQSKAETNSNEINSNYPSGWPEQLAVRREEMPKRFLTTRMKIFNSTFSGAVAEIFVYEEEFAQAMEKYKIRITQVRVSTNCKLMHIYWVTDEQIDANLVADYLNTVKGRIHQLLMESLHVNAVPWIMFVYDLQAAYDKEISTRLQKCSNDLLVEEAFEVPSLKKIDLNEQINFEDPIQKVHLDEHIQKLIKHHSPDTYSHFKMQSPDDMPMNTLNLDYEFIMGKVLRNLHHVRSQHKLKEYEQKTVGAHLPPLDLEKEIHNAQNFDYNTEERIKAIKKFVTINRKKKEKFEHKLKHKILQDEMDKFDSYEQLRNKMEQVMAQAQIDIETQPETDERSDEFVPLN